jgi:ligand-binding sensor domain-containing protein
MKKFLLLFLFTSVFYAQEKIESFSSYSAVINDDTHIYAITKKGQLTIWDTNSLKKTYTSTDTTKHYTAIAKDHRNNIYVGNKKGCVFELDKHDFSAKLFYKMQRDPKVEFIIFNNADKMYVIVADGVYSASSKKVYNQFVNRPLSGMQRVSFDKNGNFIDSNIYFNIPEIAFIDNKNRIWMSKSFGEFGTILHIFDTVLDKELAEVPDLSHIQSFSEDAIGNVYITCGLQHFMNFGSIYKISAEMDISLLFTSENGFNNEKPRGDDALFIGPGVFSIKDKKLYFSSSKGFYSAEVTQGNALSNATQLFQPKLNYVREPLAIGVGMAVKSLIQLPDGRLLFSTAANGIGIYDGSKLQMLPN